LESQYEQQLIQAGLPLDVDLLEMGHHGSQTSNSRKFLKAVSPQLAVYQAGIDNSFGHPHDIVISRLQDLGIDMMGTDMQGRIIARSDGYHWTIDSDEENTGTVKSQQPCLNLNRASREQLTNIIHIGSARADAIKQQRRWESIADLKQIDGISQTRIEDIKEQDLACIK